MAKELDPDGSGHFDFPSLTALLSRHWKTPTAPEEVIEAFKFVLYLFFSNFLMCFSFNFRVILFCVDRIFDPSGTGLISTAEMRSVMTTLGEKLTTEEAAAMIKDADPETSGKVDFSGWKFFCFQLLFFC